MALTCAMVVRSSHYKVGMTSHRKLGTDANTIRIMNFCNTLFASTMTGTTSPIGETKGFRMLLTGSVEVAFAPWIVSSSEDELIVQFAPCFDIGNSGWKLK